MNKIYISTIVFMIFLVAGCNNGEQKNNELQKKQKVSPCGDAGHVATVAPRPDTQTCSSSVLLVEAAVD